MRTTTIINRTESWPIVVANIYGSSHSEQALDEAYTSWLKLMNRGRHVLILDITRGNIASTAKDRARAADWVTKHEVQMKSRQLANVLVATSAVERGLITAVFWIKPPAIPTHIVSSIDEAVDRAVLCLHSAGVPVSDEAIAIARQAGSQANPSANAAAGGGR